MIYIPNVWPKPCPKRLPLPIRREYIQTDRCSSVVLTDPTFCFFFQNNDDSCLAYVLGAISNLLSKIGMSNTVGIISSPYSLGTNIGLGTPLSIQQQLLVLLKRSLKRADILKLASLLSFDHLSLAKFDLKVRSLLV